MTYFRTRIRQLLQRRGKLLQREEHNIENRKNLPAIGRQNKKTSVLPTVTITVKRRVKKTTLLIRIKNIFPATYRHIRNGESYLVHGAVFKVSND